MVCSEGHPFPMGGAIPCPAAAPTSGGLPLCYLEAKAFIFSLHKTSALCSSSPPGVPLLLFLKIRVAERGVPAGEKGGHGKTSGGSSPLTLKELGMT